LVYKEIAKYVIQSQVKYVIQSHICFCNGNLG
jgi:hypothetical protein